MSDDDIIENDKDDFTDATSTFPRRYKFSNTHKIGKHPVRHLGR